MSASEDEQRPSRRESPSSIRLVTVEQQIKDLVVKGDERHAQNQLAIAETKAIAHTGNQLLERICAELERVYTEVKKTNGQVTKHTAQIDQLESVRDVSKGALWSLVIALPIIGGFVGWMLAQHKP